MIPLTRTTPQYSVRPVNGGRRVVGICTEKGCTYQTSSFTSAGFLASVFAAHGLVLSDETTPGIPVCPSVMRVVS